VNEPCTASEVNERCTALVLSGGCLRGCAQIGVLKALAAAGIRIDLVVGSSVGAVVGALFAAGRTPAEIERAALALSVGRLKRWALSSRGLWNASGLEALMRCHLPHERIGAFPIRFAAVATDVATGRALAITAGDAGRAVAASAAMPGFFVPAILGGRTCADGCLTSPLPVRIARALGARRVIAVNTLFDPTRAPPGGLLDRLLHPSRLMMQALAAHEAAEADVLITPDLSGLDTSGACDRQALIDAGERDARAALSRAAAAHPDGAPGRWRRGASRPRGSSGTPAPSRAPRSSSSVHARAAATAAVSMVPT
jgi:NTE family protein